MLSGTMIRTAAVFVLLGGWLTAAAAQPPPGTMLRTRAVFVLLGGALTAAAAQTPPATAIPAPVRVAVAGTVHGHVTGFMRQVQNRPEMELVGVYERDAALRDAFRTRYEIA